MLTNTLSSNVSLDKVNKLLQSNLDASDNSNKEFINSVTTKHKEIIHSLGFCICFLICCEIFMSTSEKSFTNSISFFPNEFSFLFKTFCEDFKSVIFPSDTNTILWKKYPSDVSDFFVIIFDYYEFKYTSSKIKDFNHSLKLKLEKLKQKIHKKEKQEISYSVIPIPKTSKKTKTSKATKTSKKTKTSKATKISKKTKTSKATK